MSKMLEYCPYCGKEIDITKNMTHYRHKKDSITKKAKKIVERALGTKKGGEE